jgi:hypothetical protein
MSCFKLFYLILVGTRLKGTHGNLHGDVNVNPSAHDFTQLITGVQIQVLMILDGNLDQATKARQGSRSQVDRN